MPKVLLIRPPASLTLDLKESLENDYGGHELELGLLYIAAFLEKEGVGVQFLDMSLYSDCEKRLAEALNNNVFDFIGITSYTNTIKNANKIAGIIKQHNRQTKIVIGGIHASALPIETLEVFRDFDYLIYGEGEKAFTELVKGMSIADIKGLVWRDNGKIIQNPQQAPIEDLDSLPYPARHLLDLDKYIPPPGNYYRLPSTGILSSRGCPFQCTYCARTGSRFQNKVKLRSVESIIREIEFCISTYGIYDFRFYDDVFVIPKARLLKFCQELIKKKIKISWNCYSRVDTMDKEMLRIMRKAGCYHIKYGVEFGTQKWLNNTKKNTTLEQARKTINATKKTGIAAKASFMVGMPTETVEEMRKTIDFAKELNPTYATFSIFSPMPGSELFDEARRNKTLLTGDYDIYLNETGRILKDQLDLTTLKKIIKEAYKAVYFNPRFFLHRIVHLIRNPSIYEVRVLFRGFITVIKIIKNKIFVY